MRIHLLGLVHTETTTKFSTCAYSNKVRRFADMLTAQGNEVFLYAGERNDAHVTKHITVISRKEQRRYFGKPGNGHANISFDANAPYWKSFNNRCIREIAKRSEPGDILGITMGTSHKPIADAFPDMKVVETGIGYEGHFAPFRVYESWAWRHALNPPPNDTMRCYDTVIPNAYHPDEYPLGPGDGGYVAFIGRMMNRKGPHVAAAAAARAGVPLVVAGQGVGKVEPGRITCEDGTVVEGDVTYLGVLGAKDRTRLMQEAMATLCPSSFLEPGCGTSIESQFVGSPVISSDWGALTENVIEGETGYRCSFLSEYVDAIGKVASLDRALIRKKALERFSTEVIGPRYHDYLTRVSGLPEQDWYWTPERVCSETRPGTSDSLSA